MNWFEFRKKADLFFRNPKTEPRIPGENGVLYLLRRDILTCLGRDPLTNFQQKSHSALFPAGMAILAGIDLLAKFYRGNDTNEVGERFKDFVKKYFQLDSPGDEEAIYQLRNSLLHSFGLYSKTRTQEYYFFLTAIGGQLVKRNPGNKYQIDLITLNKRFEEAIEKYLTDLKLDVDDLQKKFLNMFKNYGSIYITKKK